MAKKQEGQLFEREGLGWYGRYYVTGEDGKRVRVCRALKTDSKVIAKRRLAKLIAENEARPEEAQRAENFEEAARRVVDEQKRIGVATWRERLRRLEMFTFPRLGAKLPKDIRPQHVTEVLKEARDLGKAQQTIAHIKKDISVVLKDLLAAETLDKNVLHACRGAAGAA